MKFYKLILLTILIGLMLACSPEKEPEKIENIDEKLNVLQNKDDKSVNDSPLFVTGEWAPYISEKLPNGGFASDIVRQAYRKVGIEITLDYYPWTRTVKILQAGEAVGSFPWTATEIYNDLYLMSLPYCRNVEQFVYIKGNSKLPSDFNGPISLKGLTVCGISEYTNMDLLKAMGIDAEECNNEEEALRKLLAGRIDTYPANPLVIEKMLSELAPERLKDIAYLKTPLIDDGMAVFVSKGRSDGQYYIDQFNKGFQLLVESGEYDVILKKHDAEIMKYDFEDKNPLVN